MKPTSFDELMKLLTLAGFVISFFWGVFQWRAAAEANARQAQFDAKKPFLGKQLELYTDATRTASSLATATDQAERARLEKRFWELYWGELAVVENQDVEAAMKAYGDALVAKAPNDRLERLSLALAHAIRISLDRSWGIHAWSER